MAEQPTSFRMVDAHCHLDLFRSTDTITNEITTGDICTIAVTNAPFLFENTQALAKSSPLILPALGLHPELVASHGEQLNQFRELLPQTRYLGEIGLDYVTKDEANRSEQRRVFATILGWCAEAGDTVLTVHSRRSAPDVISAVGDRYPGTVILHWYSGALRDLRKAVDYGFFFSINSAMLRSDSGRRIIQEIPQDRILTESDGPFARDGSVPATPSCVATAIAGIADLWDSLPHEVESLVQNNAEQALFRSSKVIP